MFGRRMLHLRPVVFPEGWYEGTLPHQQVKTHRNVSEVALAPPTDSGYALGLSRSIIKSLARRLLLSKIVSVRIVAPPTTRRQRIHNIDKRFGEEVRAARDIPIIQMAGDPRDH
jgi:hypothetical protein